MQKQPLKLQVQILLFLSLLVSGNGLLAQRQDVDAVYLKNGNVYRGLLQNTEAPGMITLETLCSNTLVFSLGDIDHMTRESVRSFKQNSFIPLDESGYFNCTDIGVLIGSGNNDKNLVFGVQMVNGYQYKSRLYAGLGAGLEFFEQAYVPLYGDISYVFGNRIIAPFVRGSIGYAVPLEDPEETWGVTIDNTGGYMYALGLGTHFRVNQHNALSVSLVYRFQSLKSIQTQEWNNDRMTLDTQYNRSAIRIGFVFD